MDDLTGLAAQVVAAYVEHNKLAVVDLPQLISGVHRALATLGAPAPVEEPTLQKATPAQIRKSISPDHLVSFEDGRPYKSMKRHLSARGLTPDDYRIKWGLPDTYPMVAPNYSAQRSALALSMGLGVKPVKTAQRARRPKGAPSA